MRLQTWTACIGMLAVAAGCANPAGKPVAPAKALSDSIAPALHVRMVPQAHHTQGIWRILLGRNGHTAVTLGHDATAKIWSVDDALLLRTISPVSDAALTPDAQTLLTTAADGTLSFWSVDRAELLATITAGKSVRGVSILAGGTHALVSGESELQIVHIDQRTVVRVAPGGLDIVGTAAQAPVAFARDASGSLHVVDTRRDGDLVRVLPGVQLGRTDGVVPSEDGEHFLMEHDGRVELRSARDGSLKATFHGGVWPFAFAGRDAVVGAVREGDSQEVLTLFSPQGEKRRALPVKRAKYSHYPFAITHDGRFVVTRETEPDHTALAVFDLSTGAKTASLLEPPGLLGVRAIQLSADDRFIMATTGGEPTRGYEASALLWRREGGAPIDKATLWEENETWATAVRDGRLVAMGGSSATFAGKRQELIVHSAGEQRSIRGRTARSSFVTIARDGLRVIDGRSDGHVSSWDLATLAGHFSDRIHLDKSGVSALALSANGRRVVAGGDMWVHEMYYALREQGEDPDKGKYVQAPLKVIDVETGETLVDRNVDSWGLDRVAISPDGSRILFGHHVADVSGAWAPRLLPKVDASMRALSFLGGSNRALVNGDIVDLRDGTIVRHTAIAGCSKSDSPEVRAVGEDGHTALAFCKGRALLWDVDTNGIRSLDAPGPITAVALASGGAYVAGAGAGFVRLWSSPTGKETTSLRLDGSPPIGIAVTPDGRFVVLSRDDGSQNVLRASDGATVSRIAAESDWIAFTEDGYFDASANADTSLVAAVDGSVGYQVQQIAFAANRPDILLERLGLASPRLVSHYRSKWERRLARLGGSEAELRGRISRAPRANIVSATVSDSKVDLSFEASDDSSDLASFDVAVNGVSAYFGNATLAGRKVSRHVEVALTAGTNRIELSVRNRGGVESLHAIREVKASHPTRGDLYYLGFGVSQYKNKSYNLAYPDQDVTELGKTLEAALGTSFGTFHGRTLVNGEVTVDAIRKAKEFVRGANPSDTVVVFVAGHGAHAHDKEATYYFATHEANARDLAGTAAPFELLEDLLVNTGARKKLLLLDTCESGEIDELPERVLVGAPGARGLRPRTTRQLVLDTRGAQPADRTMFDRNRFIYLDLLRRTGTVVLSSSRGNELSYELDELRHGAFTHALISALTTSPPGTRTGSCVTVDTLVPRLQKDVSELTTGKQHPSLERNNVAANVCLPVTY